MLQKKIIKKKALEVIISLLQEYEIKGVINISELSQETNYAISEEIGNRINKFKTELTKLKSTFDGKSS